MNVGVCATLAVGISASFCSPLIDITSWAPSLYPDTVFVVTTPVGAIYCIAFELSTLVPSPSSTRSPIWVSVEGVKLSNVISVEITTVAPFAAKLLYFVCVPCNWISIFFVPSLLSVNFVSSTFIVSSSSKDTCAVPVMFVICFGSFTVILGFVYNLSSMLSFSSVTVILKSLFSTIVDNVSLFVVILALWVGSFNSISEVFSDVTIVIPSFFATPV